MQANSFPRQHMKSRYRTWTITGFHVGACLFTCESGDKLPIGLSPFFTKRFLEYRPFMSGLHDRNLVWHPLGVGRLYRVVMTGSSVALSSGNRMFRTRLRCLYYNARLNFAIIPNSALIRHFHRFQAGSRRVFP